MDTRHDTNGKPVVSLRRMAPEVAGTLRRISHSPSLMAGVRRARGWLPGDSRFGDPLSTTPRYRQIEAVGRRLGLGAPEHGALREAGFGALQVWQWLLEASGHGRGEQLLTIVFTDLVKFSSWAVEAGDTETVALLRDVSEALEPPVIAHQGQVVKHLGDGMMAVFSDAQSALEAVCEGRDRLAAVTGHGYQPRIRAGLHTGRPRRLGGDYLGIDVNIAARLAERAAPDEVVASGETLEHLDGDRLGVRRKRTLFHSKGLPRDLAMFVVTPSG